MYDVEYVNPGYTVISERPVVPGYNADYFHDSRNILDDPYTGINKIELNGCANYCQECDRNTSSTSQGYGEGNTINEWWFGNRVTANSSFISNPICVCSPSESGFPDSDNDGISDICDQDIDNDGLTNAQEDLDLDNDGDPFTNSIDSD